MTRYHNGSHTRGSAWYLIGIICLIIVASTAVLIACTAHPGPSRAQQCRDRGGVVETDREYENRRITENGRKVTKRVAYTEYECKVNGQEVDEWR